MKLRLLVFETKSPPWVEAARAEYVTKLSAFAPFSVQILKSPAADRENAEVKRRKEGEILLKQLDPKDLLILFDEGGKKFATSEEFAAQFGRRLESGKAQMVLCIGGPYGFDESVKLRSEAQWSLSGLTYNHWVAQIVALEQLYRAWTIVRGIPYHNR